MTKISIIIPVYNAAPYLEDCLDSVCNQSYPHLEIICINDGSTDASSSILDLYAKNDDRLKIIHQENQGVSTARNKGLEIANGEYVTFVDADDYISKDIYQDCMQFLNKQPVDVLVYNFWDIYKNNKFIRKQSFSKDYDKNGIFEKIIPFMIKDDALNAVWNKIYKKKLIKDHNIKFPKDIVQGEDAIFNLSFLSKCNSIYFVDKVGYFYRQIDGSVSKDIINHDFLNRIKEVYEFNYKPFLRENFSTRKLIRLKNERFVKRVISLIYLLAKPGNKLSIFQKIKRIKRLVKDKEVQKIFNEYDQMSLIGRYELAIFKGIKNKNIFKLIILSSYSYYRNKE